MNKVPSIREALQAVETLRRFLESLNALFPQLPGGSATSPSAIQPERGGNGKAPGPWKDRIFEIMFEHGSPMRPMEIAAEYRRRGWPMPEKSNLGNIIRSTLIYAKKTDKRLVVVGDGTYAFDAQRGKQ